MALAQNKAKIFVVGAPGVGKTQLIRRFASGAYMELCDAPDESYTKEIEIPGVGKRYLEILDGPGAVGGEECDKRTADQRFAIMCVFAANNRASFDAVDTLYAQALALHPEPAFAILVGSKYGESDDAPAVSVGEAQAKAELLGAGVAFVQCTAKLGHNVHRVFEVVAEALFGAGEAARPPKKSCGIS